MPESTTIASHPAPSAAEKCHLLNDTSPGASRSATVLELLVRNHPGTMSHVTGLFARRAFNLEAIVCAPTGDGSNSRILLLVADDARLEQVERQLEKLHDVLSVRLRADLGPEFFMRVFDPA